jgi:hypothetical protein
MLLRVAGCTPQDFEVSITDGRAEEIDMDRPADLVGLTFSCNNSPIFHAEMEHQGRILTRDLRKYTGFDLVVKPKSMTVEELEAGYDKVLRRFYRLGRFAGAMVQSRMWQRAPVYAMAWWREPRRRTYRSLGRTLTLRGGDA